MLRIILRNSAYRIRDLLLVMGKTLIPFYILTEILKQTGLMTYLGEFMAPLMSLWGLPGEAAVALTTGMLGTTYAAAAVIASLDLSINQATVIGFMLTIAHSLPIEGAIVRELLPGSFWRVSLFRLVLALVTGWLMALVLL